MNAEYLSTDGEPRDRRRIGTAAGNAAGWCAALGVICVLAACASQPALKAERDYPAYAECCTRWDGMTKCTTLIDTVGTHAKLARMAVHTVGPKGDRAFVFIHGVFSDHRCWRHVASDLGTTHRLLLLDLPGCGDSPPPDDPEFYKDPECMSPSELTDRVLQALRSALAQEPEIRHITIVAHSLGGAISMRMFSDGELRSRYSDVLDRVEGLVLIAPLDLGGLEKIDPTLQRVATLTPMEVAFGRLTGQLRNSVTQGIIESVGPETPATREEADKLVEILQDADHRRATQAMMAGAAPSRSRSRYRPDWERMRAYARANRSIDIRTIIVWGARDETLPSSMGYKLWSEMPRSELMIFRNAKHSPHIEQPMKLAAIIREFESPQSPIECRVHDFSARIIGNGAPGSPAAESK